MSNPIRWFTTELRSLARKLKLTRFIGSFRRKRSYEEAFGQAMQRSIRPGDVIWDVGANVGYYTVKFSSWTGASGKVFGFEPVPASFERLSSATAQRTNTRVLNVALADADGQLPMDISSDPTAETNSLASVPIQKNGMQGGKTITVRAVTGDNLIAREGLLCPTVLKVDVEGYEEEVLLGLKNAVANDKCRAVFCEIHFGILNARGKKHAPGRIEKFFQEKGYSTRWVDWSHIEAIRKTA
jgi:FkbM family methyltransferase